MNLVIVQTYPNSMLAHIAKGLLETYGIQASLLHENFHSTASFSMGEVPLQVAEQDLERAQEILAIEIKNFTA